MIHKKYKEWIILRAYNELGPKETEELEAHLKICEDCRNEKENLNKFRQVLPNSMNFYAVDDIITESRRSLRSSIRKIRARKSFWEKISDFWRYSFQLKYKLTFGSIALAGMGFFLGYLMFFPKPDSNMKGHYVVAQDSYYQSEPQLRGLKFIDSDASDGEVEFLIEEIIPMHIKGNVNDPKIQKFLAQALLNEENPGTRLRTVSVLSENERSKPDNEMKKALINSLKFDENQGVRKEALKVLQKMVFDNDIKEALLFVLTHDKSSGMRVAAINFLGNVKEIEKAYDPKVLNVLKERELKDENDYIRNRAKTLLLEVKQ